MWLEKYIKKNTLVFPLLFFLLISFFACSKQNDKPHGTMDISKTLRLDLSSGTIVTSKDTHGGFHGDGNTYVEIRFGNESGTFLADAMSDNGDWHAFPLSNNLQAVVYGRVDGNMQYGPYITDDEGEAIIPRVEHGYYYFYDRHSESNNPKDDTKLLSRSSLNFTIALYDTDNNKLFYDKLDT